MIDDEEPVDYYAEETTNARVRAVQIFVALASLATIVYFISRMAA